MNTEIRAKLGIEFPIFAFTHRRDVVAAVTNAGGDEAARFHMREIDDGGAHADEAIILERAGMQQHLMADGDAVADGGRPRFAGDMDDGAILDIRAAADADAVHITADDDAEPDACFRPDMHITDDDGAGCDECVRMDGGSDSIIR